jgi:hypothetical protein
MYTLRDCYTTPEEFSSLLAKVRDLGFAGIELAGSGGLSAADLKAKLDELGLTIVCSHESLERLDKHLPEVLAWHQAVGCPRIALAWSPAASLDDLAELERVLRKAEPAARAAGIELLYTIIMIMNLQTSQANRPLNGSAGWFGWRSTRIGSLPPGRMSRPGFGRMPLPSLCCISRMATGTVSLPLLVKARTIFLAFWRLRRRLAWTG